ncbi:MAG: HEAT repeat domain-containing protein [Verrucomicrobiota bacterium]
MRHAFGPISVKVRTAPRGTLLFLGAFFLSIFAGMPPLAGAPPSPAGGGAENRTETIQKALDDFQSADPSIRKRAILILGKYPDKRARSALVDALADPNATVRRNALVSMTEQNWFPSRQLGSVIKLLADEDLHVRRIASSALPAMGKMLRAAFASDSPDSAGLASAMGIDDSSREAVQAAFVDSDETVRKNMLNHAYLFPGQPDEKALAKLLHDDSAEIRVKALPLAADTLPAETFAEACEKLVNDESAAVRRRLVEQLARRTTPADLKLLEALSRDSEISIVAAAVEALLRRGNTVPPEIAGNALQAPSVDANLKVRLLFALSRQTEQGSPYGKLLRNAYTSPQPRIRAAALRARASIVDAEQRKKEALSLLKDSAETVRTAAFSMLKRSADDLESEDLKELRQNPHPDIRRQAVKLSGKLSTQEARELLLDLLLDDNTSVRAQAIVEFGRRRLPGAHRILQNSLRDEKSDIKRAAAVGLLKLGDSEAANILQAHAEKEDDQQLLQAARRLRQRLQ